MDERLKPCPFCGGKAEMLYTGKYECFVHCRRGCVEQTRLYKAKSSAVKAWNRRASIDPERKTGKWIPIVGSYQWECSNCGEYISGDADCTPYINKFCWNCGATMNEGSVKE